VVVISFIHDVFLLVHKDLSARFSLLFEQLSVMFTLNESTRNLQHKRITIFLYQIAKQRNSNISILKAFIQAHIQTTLNKRTGP
jgi:hypothetical protein